MDVSPLPAVAHALVGVAGAAAAGAVFFLGVGADDLVEHGAGVARLAQHAAQTLLGLAAPGRHGRLLFAAQRGQLHPRPADRAPRRHAVFHREAGTVELAPEGRVLAGIAAPGVDPRVLHPSCGGQCAGSRGRGHPFQQQGSAGKRQLG